MTSTAGSVPEQRVRRDQPAALDHGVQRAEHPLEGRRCQDAGDAAREQVRLARLDAGEDPQVREPVAAALDVREVALDVERLRVGAGGDRDARVVTAVAVAPGGEVDVLGERDRRDAERDRPLAAPLHRRLERGVPGPLGVDVVVARPRHPDGHRIDSAGILGPVSTVIIAKLAGIFAVVAIGWVCGRTPMFRGEEPQRVLTNLAFYLFGPALLFRLTASIDLGELPWVLIAAYFVPTIALLLAVYAWRRRATRDGPVAGPGIRAISMTFGNTVQLGIPVVIALFGEVGLGGARRDRQPARGDPAHDRHRAGRTGSRARGRRRGAARRPRDRVDHRPARGRAPDRAAGAARADREPDRPAESRARWMTSWRFSGRAWCRCAWS